MAIACRFLAVLIGLLSASPAHAQTLQLQAALAPGCPPVADLVEEVNRSLAGRAHRGGLPAYRLTVVKMALGQGYRGTLSAARESRVVEAPTCAEVLSAFALTLSLALEGEPAGARGVASVEPTPAPVASQTPAPLPGGRAWSMGGGVALVGLLWRRTLWGPSLSVGQESQRRGPWSPLFSFQATPTWRSAGPGLQQAGLFLPTLGLAIAPLRLRLRGSGPASLTLRPLVGLAGGVLLARGAGLDHPRPALFPWLAATATFRLTWWAGKVWGVETEGGLQIPLGHPRLTAQLPPIELAHTKAMGGMGSLRLLVRFP